MMIGEQKDFNGYGMRCPSCGHETAIAQMRVSASFAASIGGVEDVRIQLPTLYVLTRDLRIFTAQCPKCHNPMQFFDRTIENCKKLLSTVIAPNKDGFQFSLTEGSVKRGAPLVLPALEFVSPEPIGIDMYHKVDRPASSIIDHSYFLDVAILRASRANIVDHITGKDHEVEQLIISPSNGSIPRTVHVFASDQTMDDMELLLRDITMRITLMAVCAYINANIVKTTAETANIILDIMRCCCGIEGNLVNNFKTRKIFNFD